MSWGIGYVGKAPAVRTQCATEFANNPCAEPEETVRQAAAAVIDAALASQDASNVVRVAASGSQSFKNYTDQTGVTNSLSITIEPLYGFLE
jgi:FlaG/FlaF family flagellin (archaellin)